MLNIKEKILQLNDERNIWIEKWNNSWDENNQTFNDSAAEERVDSLALQIYHLILDNKQKLEFEFIIEQLTQLGQAPCLLYDDDGHFAVVGEGYTDIVVDGPIDWKGSFIVEKEYWFNNIRSALYNYLERE